jgi:hypothetical protein
MRGELPRISLEKHSDNENEIVNCFVGWSEFLQKSQERISVIKRSDAKVITHACISSSTVDAVVPLLSPLTKPVPPTIDRLRCKTV